MDWELKIHKGASVEVPTISRPNSFWEILLNAGMPEDGKKKRMTLLKMAYTKVIQPSCRLLSLSFMSSFFSPIHSHFLNCDFLERPGLCTQWIQWTPAEKKRRKWRSDCLNGGLLTSRGSNLHGPTDSDIRCAIPHAFLHQFALNALIEAFLSVKQHRLYKSFTRSFQ